MAIRSRDRDNLWPTIRAQGFGAFRLDQLYRGGIKQAQRFQERLLTVRADHHRYTGRANVGRFGDYICHRQQGAIIVVFKFLDQEFTIAHRCIGIDQGFGVYQPQLYRLGGGKDFEG